MLIESHEKGQGVVDIAAGTGQGRSALCTGRNNGPAALPHGLLHLGCELGFKNRGLAARAAAGDIVEAHGLRADEPGQTKGEDLVASVHAGREQGVVSAVDDGFRLHAAEKFINGLHVKAMLLQIGVRGGGDGDKPAHPVGLQGAAQTFRALPGFLFHAEDSEARAGIGNDKSCAVRENQLREGLGGLRKNSAEIGIKQEILSLSGVARGNGHVLREQECAGVPGAGHAAAVLAHVLVTQGLGQGHAVDAGGALARAGAAQEAVPCKERSLHHTGEINPVPREHRAGARALAAVITGRDHGADALREIAVALIRRGCLSGEFPSQIAADMIFSAVEHVGDAFRLLLILTAGEGDTIVVNDRAPESGHAADKFGHGTSLSDLDGEDSDAAEILLGHENALSEAEAAEGAGTQDAVARPQESAAERGNVIRQAESAEPAVSALQRFPGLCLVSAGKERA